MHISILLPYKENFTTDSAGAVSLFVSDINRKSKYQKTTKIFGSTNEKNKLDKNYINLKLERSIFRSTSKSYVETFLIYQKKLNTDLLEVHNRPNYIIQIKKKFKKKYSYIFITTH